MLTNKEEQKQVQRFRNQIGFYVSRLFSPENEDLGMNQPHYFV